jgi:Trk-type K+ transport system membrane component
MKRTRVLYLFLAIYLLIFIICLSGNFSLLGDSLPANTLLLSVSQVTLTHFSFDTSPAGSPDLHGIFSILVTQATGLLFFTFLLWLYNQLFEREDKSGFSVRKALKQTLTVTIICESALLLFFLYAIPKELTNNDFSTKVLVTLNLSVSSFNNAGFSLWHNYFSEGIVENNFMIQIGVIGGTLIGGLGIFVLIDLFSPVKLRKRLVDPSIDWSFITKLSLFGGVMALAGYFAFFYFTEGSALFANKNIIESLAIGLFEASSARGFGMQIADPQRAPHLADLFAGAFGAGPFSTGGGIGLIGLLLVARIFKSKNSLSANLRIGYELSRNWLIISSCFLSFVLVIILFLDIDIMFTDLIKIYLTNHIKGKLAVSSASVGVVVLTNLAGRLSLIFAAFITLSKSKNYASGTD